MSGLGRNSTGVYPRAGHAGRGGVRVIYYWAVKQECILMLLIYPKNVKDDMTQEQLKILRKIVKEQFP
ncbi:MAG: hypothetical protein HYU84_17720 [Chloroflexi bacterium]|nr:hypothetical protein [Chloroflexota bacterium]MBI3168539.1 hypothetical protein [Chloroflexota bacterium]